MALPRAQFPRQLVWFVLVVSPVANAGRKFRQDNIETMVDGCIGSAAKRMALYGTIEPADFAAAAASAEVVVQ